MFSSNLLRLLICHSPVCIILNVVLVMVVGIYGVHLMIHSLEYVLGEVAMCHMDSGSSPYEGSLAERFCCNVLIVYH